MEYEKLQNILELHKKWLAGESGGVRANLRSANLRTADLSSANLSSANLSSADLSTADLSSANLSSANLSSADLRYANLRYANLSTADLSSANLSSADLSTADLSSANLSSANLSSAKNLIIGIDYISTFETTKQGIICYKTFGQNYATPEKWVIKPKSILSENCHPDRCLDCACGVNVSTLGWQINNNENNLPVWKCLIKWEWAVGIVVPYNTDGKIRCERCQLIAKGYIKEDGKWYKELERNGGK